MNILAFDTCFGACSVAVRRTTARGEVIVREEYEERERGHAETLIPMIERVMTGAQLEFAAIDRIALTEGPGTFTGVRVGVATARGLAVALGKPLVAMTSLMAMALRADHLLGKARGDRCLAVCVDARKGQLYAQLFGENGGDALSEPLLVTAAELAARLSEGPAGGGSPGGEGKGRWVAVGSGAKALAEAMAAIAGPADGGAAVGGPAVEVALTTLEPHARMLALLAPVMPVRDRVSPLYLRAPDAKVPDSRPIQASP